MAKYRKIPVEVEAIQLNENNFDEVNCFVGKKLIIHYTNEADFLKKINPIGVFIHTSEGRMLAKIGDFIIKGVNGEFYPCKPDIFNKTYEKA